MLNGAQPELPSRMQECHFRGQTELIKNNPPFAQRIFFSRTLLRWHDKSESQTRVRWSLGTKSDVDNKKKRN